LAVAAPYRPALSTQLRKNIFISSPDGPRNKPQNKPAARKPLYKPLISGEYFRCGRCLLVLAEDFKAFGFIPQEHFKYEYVNVNTGDESDYDIRKQ
jgi:hypothetical protein